jgi:hypothetical protein
MIPLNPVVTLARVAIRVPERYAPVYDQYLRSLDAIAVDPFDAEGHETVALSCLAAWDDPELASLLDRIDGGREEIGDN